MSKEQKLDFILPKDFDFEEYRMFRKPYWDEYKRLPRGKIIYREDGYYLRYFKFLRFVYEPIALNYLDELKEKLYRRDCIQAALKYWDSLYQRYLSDKYD